jgi:hypothetical protein
MNSSTVFLTSPSDLSPWQQALDAFLAEKLGVWVCQLDGSGRAEFRHIEIAPILVSATRASSSCT